MAPYPTSFNERDWPPGIDAQFVQRLWRPLVQPGLIKRQQTEMMLARHQQMVTAPHGDSLLAALLQRDQGLLEGKGSQVPIVYAQRTVLPLPSATDAAASVPTEAPIASNRPVVRATHSSNAPQFAANGQSRATSASPPASAPMVVQRKAAPGTPSVPTALQLNAAASAATVPSQAVAHPVPESLVQHRGSTPVVQRKVAPDATTSMPAVGMPTVHNPLPVRTPRRAPGTTAAEHTPTLANITQTLPLLEPSPRLEALPGRLEIRPDEAITQPAGLTGAALPVIQATQRAASLVREAVLPWVRPLPSGAEEPPWPHPVVRVAPRSQVTECEGQAQLPVTEPTFVHTLPVVREQTRPAPVRLPDLPVAQTALSQAPATLAPFTQTSLTAPSVAAAQSTPRGAVVTGTTLPAPRQNGTAANALVTPPPTPAQIDIDRIVEKVERKFMQRLAAESERRGRSR